MSFIEISNGEKHEFCEHFYPDINDIAWALSNINRFTGRVGQYSVAQHSILVAEQLPDELKLSGLLHDASEAYIGDVAKPLKDLLPDYQKIEAWYEKRISNYFGVDIKHPEIKKADIRMLVTEAEFFNLKLIREHHERIPAYDISMRVMSPNKTYRDFINAFYKYGGKPF